METETLCPMFSCQNGDGAHLFLKCKVVKALWQEMQMSEDREHLLLCEGPKDLISKILQMPGDKSLKCVMMLWTWWDTRNKKNAGEPQRNQISVAKRVHSLVQNWQMYALKGKSSSQEQSDRRAALNQYILQINVDGSMKENPTHGGWGFMIRDHAGRPVGAGAGHMQYVSDPLYAEATACLQSLYAAQGWGMSRVHVLSDSKTLVQAATSNDHDLSTNGNLFKEIRCFASLNFTHVGFSYCPRACNKVADALAHLVQTQGLYPQLCGRNKLLISCMVL